MKAKTLTPAQASVVQAMTEGAYLYDNDYAVILRRNNGYSSSISRHTLNALKSRKIVKTKGDSFRYYLSDETHIAATVTGERIEIENALAPLCSEVWVSNPNEDGQRVIRIRTLKNDDVHAALASMNANIEEEIV